MSSKTVDAVLEEIEPYNWHAGSPNVESSALLVIDMQDFFKKFAAEIVPNVAGLVDAARAAGRPVIWTRHGHHDLKVDGGVLAPWWDYKLSMYGSPEWQILPGLEPAADEMIVEKTRYSAFYGTGLEDHLRTLGITDLVISGVMTNCCCETNARDAFVRDFNVFLAADGTATHNEDLHISSLKGMAYSCTYVTSTANLEEAFRASVS
ncbi:MAG: isochorismatase family protein [Solirubrobacteraceae bacterium]|nr:isochorismatase family protein [Solirubrobacteraceae bacterium]